MLPRLAFGYSRDAANPLVPDCDAAANVVNLAHYLRLGDAGREVLRNAIVALVEQVPADSILGESGSLLDEHLRNAAEVDGSLGAKAYAALASLVVEYYACIHGMRLRRPDLKIEWIPGKHLYLPSWEPKLYLRYGMVEALALGSYLRDPQQFADAVETVAGRLGDLTYMTAPRMGDWLSTADFESNVRALMTNAGFYVPRNNSAAPEAVAWCERYLDGLAAADCFFGVGDPARCAFLPIQDALFRRGATPKPYAWFPDTRLFYESLAGKHVAFMTIHAEKVRKIYEAGNLRKLYCDVQIPEFRLTALPAYMSIYPNRPHESWSASLERMKASVDAAYRNSSFDLFIASCGCYGIPICHYVHHTYGCTSVYFGHATTGTFGIKSNATVRSLEGTPNWEVWESSDLGALPGLSRVDDGRYV